MIDELFDGDAAVADDVVIADDVALSLCPDMGATPSIARISATVRPRSGGSGAGLGGSLCLAAAASADVVPEVLPTVVPEVPCVVDPATAEPEASDVPVAPEPAGPTAPTSRAVPVAPVEAGGTAGVGLGSVMGSDAAPLTPLTLMALLASSPKIGHGVGQ